MINMSVQATIKGKNVYTGHRETTFSSRKKKFIASQEAANGLRKILQDIKDDQVIEVRMAVDRSLKAIQNQARRNLKANWNMRTRKLWRSIRYVLDLDGFGGIVGTFQRDDDNWYGHFLEFGTRRGVEKRSWLYPAYKQQMRPFKNRLVRALRKSIKQNAI